MSFPKEFLDAHHHFLDTSKNGETFQKFLAKLLPNVSYLADDYRRDVILPLEQANVKFVGSVHMECKLISVFFDDDVELRQNRTYE